MKQENNILDAFLCALLAISIAICCYGLIGCKSVKYVPIQSERKDSTHIVTTEYDSASWHKRESDTLVHFSWMMRDTIIRDSIYIIEKVDGSREYNREYYEKIVIHEIDSIYNNRYVEDLKAMYKGKLDSLSRIIQDNKDTPILVEKPKTWWQKLQDKLGTLLLIAVVIGLIFAIYIYVRKKF